MYGDYSSFGGNEEALATGLFAMGTFSYLLSLAISVFSIVCMWKVFKKAGRNGWEAIIPIYNVVVLFEICGINPLVILWMLLPIVGWIIYMVYAIKSYFNLAKAFGQSTGFGLGLLFINPVFMALLAFGNYQYQGKGSN